MLCIASQNDAGICFADAVSNEDRFLAAYRTMNEENIANRPDLSNQSMINLRYNLVHRVSLVIEPSPAEMPNTKV